MLVLEFEFAILAALHLFFLWVQDFQVPILVGTFSLFYPAGTMELVQKFPWRLALKDNE